MSLNTPQNERVHDARDAVLAAATILGETYYDGDDAMQAEDSLDDAILAYVKARGR